MDERINDRFIKKRHAIQSAKVEAFLLTQGADTTQGLMAWSTLTAHSDHYACDVEAYRLAEEVNAYDLSQGGDGACLYAVTRPWIAGHMIRLTRRAC